MGHVKACCIGKWNLEILKIVQILDRFGNLSHLFMRTNYSDPGKKLEDTCGLPENIIFWDMGHK